MKRWMKKAVSLLLALCIAASTVPVMYADASSRDTSVASSTESNVTFISGTAFLDTGWGDDEFELYPRIQNKASITEYGFSCWDTDGNAICGIDSMTSDLTVPPSSPLGPGTRNYICCMAYVDEYGLHGALKEGATYYWTVYVICDGVKYTSPEYSFVFSIEDTRFPPVRGISLGVSTISMKVGEEETLNPTITPENAINKNIFWTSSNEAVATVTDGTVTAVAEGTALITATTENSGLKSSCTVTVSAASTDVPTIVDSGYCGGEGDGTNLTWTLDSDGVLTISGTGKMADYTTYLNQPWHLYKEECTALVLGNGITSIGDYAFDQCEGFTGCLTIPSSVTSIGKFAFGECSGFTGSLTIPNSVTSIGDTSFYGCSGFTGDLVIPDSVTALGGGAFQLCSGLSGRLTLPDSITKINADTFFGCSGLTGKLIIPNSVTDIYHFAFQKCSGFDGVYFEGKAPNVIAAPFFECSFDEEAILYYIPGTTGWTDSDAYDTEAGTWNGYKLEEWAGSQDGCNGTDPAVSTVYIKSMTPNHVCLTALNTATIVFNTDMKKGSGAIALKDKETGQTLCSIPVSGDAVQCSGNTVTVNFSYEINSRSRSCYVQIDSGAFVSESGTPFYGLYDTDAWNVELYKQISGMLTVTREWEQAGIFPFLRDDHSKPPIPAGSDEQYAQMLSLWAEEMGMDWLTPTRAHALLDTPVYLPVTDSNGTPVLLNDDGTTVRQVIEDVIFARDLQEYIRDLDQQIENLEAYNTQNRALFYNQEAEIYEMVLSWYPQIQKYLTRRDQKSNIFWSLAAPDAYHALLNAADSYGGTVYTYIKPLLKAELQYSDFTESLRSLENYRAFSAYKSEAESINLAFQAGKTAYTAYAEGEYGGVLKFCTNLTMKYFGASDNQVLQEISTVWKQYDSMKSAVSVSMVLGSSIGLFPLVMDFSKTLYQKTTDQVKAVYFIGDYYIQEKYPAFYQAVYDSETCMPEHIIDAYLSDALPAAYKSDMALSNWIDFLRITDIETVLRSDCIEMRRDLANYTLLLRYIRSIDTVETTRMLVAYLDAENNAGATTSLYVKCPVTVEIYDESGDMLASLSSEDASIQDCAYGSLYLMGEDNEAKVFVLNSDAYTAKIIPYDDGTMDVLLVQTDESGTQAATYYEAVAITEGTPLELDMAQQKLVENGTELTPESSIPVQSVTISGEQAVAVGQSTMLQAHVGPTVASDTSVTWRSADDSVASVTQDGLVTANAEGVTQIIAEASNGVTGVFSLQTYTAAASVVLETETLTMTVGESFDPGAVVLPADASHSLQWSSSEPSVASVDENGLIQAYAAGSAILRAEIDGVLAEIYVSVFDTPLTVTTYQSDTNGNQLKIDIINHSQSFFTGTIVVAIYNNDGQFLFSNCFATSLAAQEKVQQYLTLNTLTGGAGYTVKAFVLNEEFAPTQNCSQGAIIT